MINYCNMFAAFLDSRFLKLIPDRSFGGTGRRGKPGRGMNNSFIQRQRKWILIEGIRSREPNTFNTI